MKSRTTIVACTLLGAVVVGVSVALTLRNATAVTPPRVRRFSGSVIIQSMPSLLASPKLTDRIAVDILRDEASAQFYDSTAVLDLVITAWHDALVAAGADVRVVSPAHMGEARSARVLVIPSSPCLTIASRQAIEAAAEEGRGLILTGLTGSRDIGCRSIGYGLIVATTGAARVERLEPRDMVYVAFPSGGPLAADIPPGARLELNPGTQVALRDAARDAFYSDYSLRPQPANAQPLLDAAVTHAMLGNARVVYWGFELRDVAAREWSKQIARLLVRNSITWAADVPTVSLEAWPKGRQAAAAIAQDVEDQFANAKLALDSLDAAHVRGTYFLTSRLAQRYTRLSRQLAASGEVGTHSENHWVLGGMPADVQRERLLDAQHDLRDMLGKPVLGLRPPEEQFDGATLDGWAFAGGAYMFSANDLRSASPELLAVGRDTLVLIGRAGSDDFAAVGRHRDDPGAASAVFLDDFDRVRALGGVYVLSYHSQLLARPELVPALARVARAIASDTSVWCTTTGNIAAWWRARADVRASIDASRSDRVEIVVHNRGADSVHALVVKVENLPARQPIESDARLLAASPTELRIALPSLSGGERRTFVVRYPVVPHAVRPAGKQSVKPAAKAARRAQHVKRERQGWSWRRLLPWR